ncbi:DUF4810 domain-containing protein [Rheinheimera sediminis]|uniref:DUF4810 domain-containing protein n=1 Tax=Rheinheimera sp. YQF-1 TaxID=2499626 RepID=UPI000FDC69DA|nr:DUF4810 domain-containing protein [Rheinheimera sp. YQF-1]RVT43056.1 DUF4810 domain-containing protein [Rheinheimera sp. YQF-1]
MKDFLQKALILVCVFGVSACASTNKSIYHWGDYSETAYDYKHEPSDETREKHKKALLAIIANAAKANKKIPPGIYAELATLELQVNNLNEAQAYLLQEKALFPESAHLVDTMLNKLNKAG